MHPLRDKAHGPNKETCWFLYNMIDAGNCEINPFPLDVEAKNMGHALQKIAACLSNDCVQVIVWRKGE